MDLVPIITSNEADRAHDIIKVAGRNWKRLEQDRGKTRKLWSPT